MGGVKVDVFFSDFHLFWGRLTTLLLFLVCLFYSYCIHSN